MTPISPLQLKQYFFTLLSIQANPKGLAKGQSSLEPTISFQKLAEEANEWNLGLRVVLRSEKTDAPFLYEIDAQIQGRVTVHDSFAQERREQLAVVNGLGMLYAAVREMVMNVTARSVHAAVTLPALNFVEIVANVKTDAATKAATLESQETTHKTPASG